MEEWSLVDNSWEDIKNNFKNCDSILNIPFLDVVNKKEWITFFIYSIEKYIGFYIINHEGKTLYKEFKIEIFAKNKILNWCFKKYEKELNLNIYNIKIYSNIELLKSKNKYNIKFYKMF